MHPDVAATLTNIDWALQRAHRAQAVLIEIDVDPNATHAITALIPALTALRDRLAAATTPPAAAPTTGGR